VGSEHYEAFMAACPTGRNGDPELDIGAVALFLCSDACRFLTGQTFMVDGGTFLWS
jgi:NAD(P)-dependent dehydrogenase (short-subunit alcohol dehydrogenase family)